MSVLLIPSVVSEHLHRLHAQQLAGGRLSCSDEVVAAFAVERGRGSGDHHLLRMFPRFLDSDGEGGGWLMRRSPRLIAERANDLRATLRFRPVVGADHLPVDEEGSFSFEASTLDGHQGVIWATLEVSDEPIDVVGLWLSANLETIGVGHVRCCLST